MRGGEAGPVTRGPGLQSTKSRILAVLKRRGRCSVDEIAAHVDLAPMTVRHHLANLERDDLVACVEERQRTGRPHYVYSLSPQGESGFRRHDNHLAEQLLLEVRCLDGAEIAGLAPDEKTGLLFDKLADRLVSQHAPRLARLAIPQRVAAITDLLRQESGFAESLPIDGGWEIRDYNCCYRELHGSTDRCRWHGRLLVGLLGRAVQPACDDPHSSADACRFVVSAADSPPAPEVAAGYPLDHAPLRHGRSIAAR